MLCCQQMAQESQAAGCMLLAPSSTHIIGCLCIDGLASLWVHWQVRIPATSTRSNFVSCKHAAHETSRFKRKPNLPEQVGTGHGSCCIGCSLWVRKGT
jgi:hypothetical protein